MAKIMIDFKWEMRTYFIEKQDFLDAMKTYALENGKNLKFVKNDKRTIKMKCVGAKGQGPWMAYSGYMEAVDTWQLRNVVNTHRCIREHNLRLLNVK